MVGYSAVTGVSVFACSYSSVLHSPQFVAGVCKGGVPDCSKLCVGMLCDGFISKIFVFERTDAGLLHARCSPQYLASSRISGTSNIRNPILGFIVHHFQHELILVL